MMPLAARSHVVVGCHSPAVHRTPANAGVSWRGRCEGCSCEGCSTHTAATLGGTTGAAGRTQGPRAHSWGGAMGISLSPALAPQLTPAKEVTRETAELGSEALDKKLCCQTGAPSPEASDKPASTPPPQQPLPQLGSQPYVGGDAPVQLEVSKPHLCTHPLVTWWFPTLRWVKSLKHYFKLYVFPPPPPCVSLTNRQTRARVKNPAKLMWNYLFWTKGTVCQELWRLLLLLAIEMNLWAAWPIPWQLWSSDSSLGAAGGRGQHKPNHPETAIPVTHLSFGTTATCLWHSLSPSHNLLMLARMRRSEVASPPSRAMW